MAAREEWALLTCLILFISGVAANKFNSITGSQLVKSTSYHDRLTIAKLHNSKAVVGTCEYSGQFLPDSIDCSIFYVCDFGTPPTPQLQRCPTEQCFDTSVNQCTDDCTSCSQCEEGEEFSNPENCASYYICSSEKEPVLVTCGEGQFYDEEKMGCFYVVDCGKRPGCHAKFEAYPNCQDSTYKSFYICNATLFPVKSSCPTGKCFDDVANACIPATGPTGQVCTVPPICRDV